MMNDTSLKAKIRNIAKQKNTWSSRAAKLFI